LAALASLREDELALEAVLGDPPVAVDDTAYTGPGEPRTDQLTITVYVLRNDTGQGIMVTGVGQPSHGTASGYGYYVYYTPGSTFGFGPGKSSTDSFAYTIRDSYGRTASATVTVNAVEVTGYTVEWQKPDGTWQALGDEDVSWVGDQLRWTPQYNFSSQYFTGSALWRKPYGDPSGWAIFATGGAQVYTGADRGEWSVQAQARFAGMPWQSGFAARQETQGHRLTAEITSIQWETHSANPAQTIRLSPDERYVRGYPDAANPGEPMRDKIDVVVSVFPQKANIPVLLNWYDADESAGRWVLDELDPQNAGVNPPDNFSGGRPVADASLPAGPFATDAAGRVRTTLTINWAQPGNNYRVAATPGGLGREAVLAPLKPLAPDTTARLFYDRNGDGLLGQPPDEPTLDEWSAYNSIRISPELKLWRKLHVEVDSMGPVQGNTVTGQITDVAADVPNMRATVTTDQALDAAEQDRFLPGQLTNNNRDFNVLSHTTGASFTMTVQLYGDPNNPEVPAVGPFLLVDDDEQPMPEAPNAGLTELAYGDAYILPVVDGGGNSANNKNNVAFAANIPDDEEGKAAIQQIEKPNAIESHANRSVAYWVGYLQAAYQGDARWDGDPDAEQESDSFLLGVTAGFEDGGRQAHIGSLVFQEAIRDLALARGWTPTEEELIRQRTVVHEIAHQFGLEDDKFELQPPSVMSSAATDPQNAAGSQFNQYQQAILRQRMNSPGLWE
jgi:hypothetical protein